MPQQDDPDPPDKPIRVQLRADLPITAARFWQVAALNPCALEHGGSGGPTHAQLLNAYLAILAEAGSADRETLRRTLNWLELMIAMRARHGISMAARLLAAMAPELLASDFSRIMIIFNSRILAMIWRVTPDLDVRPLPPNIPRFGDEAGFGLIRSVPELYAKLALLAPEMEEIVIMLVMEAQRYGVSLPPELAAMAPPPAASG